MSVPFCYTVTAMDDFLAARLTMALSLGFHIILAAIGMIMPFFMALAHHRWLRTGAPEAYRLTRAWTRGVAIFFATGAVSGTALSFELGLLWPGFMLHAGPIIGMPFSLEGAAFFVEAIALGIYLYGWGRLPAWLHWGSGVVVGIAGLASGMLVIAANGWMNSPTGFDWVNGAAENIDPWAAMLNPAWLPQAGHMLIASFEAVAFAVVGVHVWLARRGGSAAAVGEHAHSAKPDPMHALAIRLLLPIAAVAALAQPLHGHFMAQDVAQRQPVKLAAMEALFQSQTQAPLLLGGWPDVDQQKVHYGIEIPGALSFLATNDFNAPIQGLDAVPRELWPPVPVVHVAFQVMVAIGSYLALLGLVAWFAWHRRPRWWASPLLHWALVTAVPLGFVAIEAGWVVTEVGRQPWIIYGIMRTAEALTPVPGQVWHLLVFTLLYAVIGLCSLWMWQRQVRAAHALPPPTEALRRWAGLAP